MAKSNNEERMQPSEIMQNLFKWFLHHKKEALKYKTMLAAAGYSPYSLSVEELDDEVPYPKTPELFEPLPPPKTFDSILLEAFADKCPKSVFRLMKYYFEQTGKMFERKDFSSRLSKLQKKGFITTVIHKKEGAKARHLWALQNWVDKNGELKIEFAEKIEQVN